MTSTSEYSWRPARSSGAFAAEPSYVVVTGGVASSLGKGLTASSLALLLSRRGLRVAMAKADPYLNVDAGTMAPGQHGEVFVTFDGGETDLDLGNYERFLDQQMPARANLTTGQIYSRVMQRERSGGYLGQTVQVVPHIVDEIKERIRSVAALPEGVADVVVLEVGGTVGDIESLPFLEAVRQLRHEVGRSRFQVVHVTLVPEIGPSREVKTKPTQHSVAALRSIGLTPDVLVCRANAPLAQSVKSKLALFCDVDTENIVSAADAASIYSVPRALHLEGLDAAVIRALGLPFHDVDWSGWSSVVDAAERPSGTVEIAMVGKYVDSPDAYLSVVEALRAAGFALGQRIEVRWVDSESISSEEEAAEALEGVGGLLVPGGFGERGLEGKLSALAHARTSGLPALGICLGMQAMVIEAARHLAGLEGATSTEFDPVTSHPVISTMADQLDVVAGRADMGGTMRLGTYPQLLAEGSRMRQVYAGAPLVRERHRHRYEVNNAYRQALEEAGLRVAATSPDGRLVEGVELTDHPFYMGVQAHPEFDSRPTRPHPLFAGFVAAAFTRTGA